MSINQIIKGTVKNILNRDQDLFQTRIAICRQCRLRIIDSIFGEVCNPSLYLNPNTGEVSNKPQEGFKNGCGCILGSKTRVEEAECPLGKW